VFQNFGNISCSFHTFMTYLTVIRMKAKQSSFFYVKVTTFLAKLQDTTCVKRDGNRFIRLKPFTTSLLFPYFFSKYFSLYYVVKWHNLFRIPPWNYKMKNIKPSTHKLTCVEVMCTLSRVLKSVKRKQY